MSTIGMMDGAFFVGRKEIMDWINSTLEINLSKVEDTANGAVACQLLDIMYPGQVAMHKVNWSAKQDFEFVANYKILQNSFTKLNIERHIDVDRLISGRYMDNLEFMQWFKRFFEMSVTDIKDYDLVAQRSKGKGGAQYGGGKRSSSIKPSSAPPRAGAPVSKPVATKPATLKPSVADHSNHKPTATHTSASAKHLDASSSVSSNEVAALRAANEESARAFADLKVEMEGLEKERDFYFEKLRDVEVLMQDLEDRGEGSEVTASVMKILYATADGFEQVDVEEGEPESDLPTEAATEDTF